MLSWQKVNRMANLFAALVNRARKLTFLFSEKSPVTVEDCELEHLLLYHGLVGSSAENQRDYKDVRIDIHNALNSCSALQLGMALKLPPLYWEDKLKRIFSELTPTERTVAASTLLPETGDAAWPNIGDPLGHNDWRVRANAASILSFLQAQESTERMIAAMHDTVYGAQAAFPHIANALARLGNDKAKEALISHLDSEERWFRVDAATALASWPLAEVGKPLMNALLGINALGDYMAVSIARKIPPVDLLKDSQELLQDGACQLVLGLLEASKQTFSKDLLTEIDLTSCLPSINDLIKVRPTTVSLRAALECAKIWSESPGTFAGQGSRTEVDQVIVEMQKSVRSQRSKALVNQKIAAALDTTPVAEQSLNDLRHAVRLAAELRLDQTNQLLRLLELRLPIQEDIVLALGSLGHESAAPALISLAQSIFFVQSRAALPKSKQPVAEDRPDQARLFWHILQALGNIPSPQSVAFLLEAANDFAPDKRQQAIESLILQPKFSSADKAKFIAIVDQSLQDPAPSVRVTALSAVASLNDAQFLEKVLRLSESTEITISRQAFKTLEHFWRQGNRQVPKIIETKLANEHDQYKRKRLSDFLEKVRR